MQSGRPRKHCRGWEGNARIYLNNETLVEWQRLHNEQDLTSTTQLFLYSNVTNSWHSNTWLFSSLFVSLSLAFDLDSSQHMLLPF